MMKKAFWQNLRARKAGGRLFNYRPTLFLALFLCLGIAFAYLRDTAGLSPWWSVLPVAGALCLVKTFRKGAVAAVCLLLAFCFGAASCFYALSSFREIEIAPKTYTVQGRVVERALGGEKYEVRLDGVKLDGRGVKGLFVAYLPAELAQSLQLSDRVEFKAFVRENNQLFSTYGFRAEALAEGRRFYASGASDFQVTGHMPDFFLTVRERITQAVQKGMDEEAAAFTLAVLLGDTTAVDGELLENIRNGGIAHIFAVSGLHIGTLFGAVTGIMDKKKGKRLPRLLRFALVGAIVLGYGAVCGYSASVIRAIVTCLVTYAVRSYGGKTDSVEATSLAAVCVLVYQPTQLFAVGFQLSFLACYGIAFLFHPVSGFLQKSLFGLEKLVREKLFKRPLPSPDPFAKEGSLQSPFTRFSKKLSGFLGVSFAAQVFTFPVLLMRFGEVAELGVLLNLFFVPLLSVAFCPLLIFVLVAALVGAFETLILAFPNAALSVTVLAFELTEFHSSSYSAFSWSGGALALYYACVLCLSDKCNLTRWQRGWCVGVGGIFLLAALFA